MTFQIRPVWGADNSQKLLLAKSFSTESGDELKVNGCAGNVKVGYWFRSEIEVKVYGSSDAGKYLDFDVISDELGIRICVLKKTGMEKVKNFSLRYEINVPRDYIVKVSRVRGNVSEDQGGSVEIGTPGVNVHSEP
jgi:hypothetical protein